MFILKLKLIQPLPYKIMNYYKVNGELFILIIKLIQPLPKKSLFLLKSMVNCLL